MKIRQAAKDDLAAILAIQSQCLQAASWREADYAQLADDHGGLILVAEFETLAPPRVAGFAVFRRVLDEAELMNLAVDPAYRHRGLARAMLEEAGRRLIQAGTRRIFLEVRPSNKPALGLYYSLGYALRSLRRNYYRDPEEDAFVLSLDLVRFLREGLTERLSDRT